jgi:glycosyltransferase involved in cell wall biosynthesis
MPARTLIIVAAYNEAERIPSTLNALALAFPDELVWVADDGSTDGTPEIALGAGARLVRSERVIGKGAAVTRAAEAAVSELASAGRDGEEPVFLLCDGDLGESAARLDVLAEVVRRGDADVAVAAFARRLGGGFGVAVSFARWAIRRRCGFDARAPISGQRALSEQAMRDVLPLAAGFGMEVGMTIDAVRAGHAVAEIEIDLDHRATGRTPAGFAHRARQLVDFARVYVARGALGSPSR